MADSHVCGYLERLGFERNEKNSLFHAYSHGMCVAIVDLPSQYPLFPGMQNIFARDFIDSSKDLVKELTAASKQAQTKISPYNDIGRSALDAIVCELIRVQPEIGDYMVLPENFLLSLERLQYRGDGIHARIEACFRNHLHLSSMGHELRMLITHQNIGRVITASSIFTMFASFLEDKEKEESYDFTPLFTVEDANEINDIVDTMQGLFENSHPKKSNETLGHHAHILYKHEEKIEDIEECMQMEFDVSSDLFDQSGGSTSKDGNFSSNSKILDDSESDGMKNVSEFEYSERGEEMEEERNEEMKEELGAFEFQFKADQRLYGDGTE